MNKFALHHLSVTMETGNIARQLTTRSHDS